MFATRRIASHDERRNATNSNPPPPNPPTIEQALMMQTRLLYTIVQIALDNQHQTHPIDKRGEFMKGHQPTFSHTSDPIEADD